MNKKMVSILALVVLIGVVFIAWQSYSGASNQIENQKASIYDVTGEPLVDRSTYSDAITWQVLGEDQCLGLNNKGQALIGTTFRKSFSFSRGCKIIDTDSPNTTASNVPDSQRFWFGGLVGSQCYSVTTDNAGNPNGVFLEEDIKDKNICLIN